MPNKRLWAEVWARPGAPTFGRVIDDPPNPSMSFHDGVNVTGDGNMQIPSSFDRFDEILKIDRANTAMSVSSLIRIFSEDDPTTPVFEWLPRSILPTTSKSDPSYDIAGFGIKSVVGYARVEAWDWDGTTRFVSSFPDWIYGGRSILTNGGMEDTSATPTVYHLVIDASAGTMSITDGTDTAAGIAYNVSDGVLEGDLETDIAAIDDLLVSPLDGPPLGYQLIITATGGTFVINSPADNTGALAAGISGAALTTALEGLSDVTDVTVTAITDGFQIDLVTPASISLSIDTTNLTDGSAQFTVSNTGTGFEIELVNPPSGITLNVNDAGLTGSADMVLVQEGFNEPQGWTKSQQISVGTPREFGLYDAFEQSSAQAHSGTYSLFINPGTVAARIDAFAGTQQIVQVSPGGLYQASVWVYPTAAGQTYRLVIRGIDEDLIKGVNISPPANTWTEVVLPDVQIGGDSRVIFRFANTQLSGNPAGFYVDDAAFREGMAATTLGQILTELYDDATTDHAGRVVWEDEANSPNPYLTLDFDAAQDSNGNTWAHDELEVKLWMRMTYLQVMEQFALTYGYEWRIVPDDVEAGTWLWQVFNPNTMGTDHTGSVSPAIQGGSSDTRRSLQQFVPAGTNYLVEGLARVTARATDTGLDSALGRIESSRIDRELPTQPAIVDGATEDALTAVDTGVQYVYTLAEPVEAPLVSYQLGDILTIHDPPEVSDNGRFIDVEVTVNPTATEYETIFVPDLSSPGSP